MPSIQPNHLLVRLTDKNTTKHSSSVMDVVSTHGKDAAGFVKNLSLTLAGTGIIGLSGIGKSIAPDNTFFDKFSLVGIIIGAITAIWGGVGLYNGNKQIKQAEIPATPFTIDNTVASNITDTVKELGINPNTHFTLSNYIVDGDRSRAPQLRDHCYNLAMQWIDPNNGFMNIINSNNGRNELNFENGNGINSNITSEQLKERMAILLGYVVGSRANANALDTESRNITDLLCLDQIEDPDTSGRCEIELMLPDEFILLYSAARHYKLNHMDRDDSISSDSLQLRGVTTPISQTDTVTNLGLASGDPAKDAAKDNAKRVANSRNYLRSLQKGIEFVIEVEKTKQSGQTVDATRQRDADILRSALVTGLGLHVTGITDTVDKLERILNGHTSNSPGTATGTPTSLKDKINTLEQFWSPIDNAIRTNTNSGLTLQAINLRFELFNQAGLAAVV